MIEQSEETINTCAVCKRKLHHQATTCGNCQTQIRQNLDDLIELYALAENALLPGIGGSGRSTERPIGIRIDALDFIAGNTIIDIVEMWERAIRDHYNLTPYGPATAIRNAGRHNQAQTTLTGCVGFLKAYLPDLCSNYPAIYDLAIEIRQCKKAAERAAGITTRRAWNITCPGSNTDGDECGMTLRITGTDLAETIHCHWCASSWTASRLMAIAITDPASDIWCAPEDAATLIGVDQSTLRRWATKGRIQRRHGLYSLTSIRTIVSEATA